MKAYVKVNIQIQFEGTGQEDGSKYPLSAHHAGEIEVVDVGEGERAMAMLSNHVNSMFSSMSVKVLPPGSHKPDLKAAFGGDPEPGPLKNGDGH